VTVVKLVVEIDYCERCHKHTDPRDLVGNALYDSFGSDESLSYKVSDGISTSEREA
jgi:hypothetical protein